MRNGELMYLEETEQEKFLKDLSSEVAIASNFFNLNEFSRWLETMERNITCCLETIARSFTNNLERFVSGREVIIVFGEWKFLKSDYSGCYCCFRGGQEIYSTWYQSTKEEKPKEEKNMTDELQINAGSNEVLSTKAQSDMIRNLMRGCLDEHDMETLEKAMNSKNEESKRVTVSVLFKKAQQEYALREQEKKIDLYESREEEKKLKEEQKEIETLKRIKEEKEENKKKRNKKTKKTVGMWVGLAVVLATTISALTFIVIQFATTENIPGAVAIVVGVGATAFIAKYAIPVIAGVYVVGAILDNRKYGVHYAKKGIDKSQKKTLGEKINAIIKEEPNTEVW